MIISNNLIGKLDLPKDTIIRVNLAWIKTVEEAKEILDKSEHDIYLDYPDGRNKPPKPVIKLKEALELAKHDKVKYFAISNAESVKKIKELMTQLPDKQIVPKIETILGVKIIPELIEIGIKHIMLDKEDLYVNLACKNRLYNELVEEVRYYRFYLNVLELQGVIFI